MAIQNQKTVALLVAAGSSSRYGRDKLWLSLGRCSVMAQTLSVFLQCKDVGFIILVIAPRNRLRFQQLLRSATFRRHSSRISIVEGGPDRQDSVWNGIQALPKKVEIVLIHDSARCCITPRLISETITAARLHGAAIAAIPLTDTIKEIQNPKSKIQKYPRIARTLDRSRLWAAQTPQAFRADLIRHAYSRVMKNHMTVTDDAAAVEALGQPIDLVPGDSSNLKITYPTDLILAREILRRAKQK